tara:strand:+ start:577 stop:1422 length:846 start_codon:yes stop_codon:yes gene_type:complete
MDSNEPIKIGSGNLTLPEENVDSPEPTENEVEETTQVEETTDLVETTASVEEPTKQNETERSEKDGESESPNPSKVINDLGEDKKKLAQDLISLASESENAKELVKQRIADDPKMDLYLKKKFGAEYDLLFKEQQATETTSEVDLDKIREEERAKIKADMIFEQVESQKSKEIEIFAVQKGFNSTELEQLKEYVSLLESKEDLDVAIQKGGLLVNQSKTLSKQTTSEPKSESMATDKAPEEKTYTDDFASFAKRHSRDPQEYYNSLKSVEDKLDGDTFKLM